MKTRPGTKVRVLWLALFAVPSIAFSQTVIENLRTDGFNKMKVPVQVKYADGGTQTDYGADGVSRAKAGTTTFTFANPSSGQRLDVGVHGNLSVIGDTLVEGHETLSETGEPSVAPAGSCRIYAGMDHQLYQSCNESPYVAIGSGSGDLPDGGYDGRYLQLAGGVVKGSTVLDAGVTVYGDMFVRDPSTGYTGGVEVHPGDTTQIIPLGNAHTLEFINHNGFPNKSKVRVSDGFGLEVSCANSNECASATYVNPSGTGLVMWDSVMHNTLWVAGIVNSGATGAFFDTLGCGWNGNWCTWQQGMPMFYGRNGYTGSHFIVGRGTDTGERFQVAGSSRFDGPVSVDGGVTSESLSVAKVADVGVGVRYIPVADYDVTVLYPCNFGNLGLTVLRFPPGGSGTCICLYDGTNFLWKVQVSAGTFSEANCTVSDIQ